MNLRAILSGLLIGGISLVAAGDFLRIDPQLKVESPELSESSGLAISTRDANFMWVLNDSGAKAVLHLAGIDGKEFGKVTVEGARNIDWEDMSSFKLGGISYLLVADAGDNNSTRDDCVLYVLEEPPIPKDGKPIVGSVKVAWRIDFNFEDGPRDCESVAVDVGAGKVILVSKRTKPPMVYELPLKPTGKERAIAKKIGETSVPAPKNMAMLPYIAQPTGMDISSDGKDAVIVSYYGVFLFPRTAKESWAEAFAKAPVPLGPHGMSQAEAVAFSADGKTLSLVSERGDRRIIRYSR